MPTLTLRELSLTDLMETFFNVLNIDKTTKDLEEEWGKNFEKNMEIAVLAYMAISANTETILVKTKFPEGAKQIKIFFKIGNALARTGIKV